MGYVPVLRDRPHSRGRVTVTVGVGPSKPVPAGARRDGVLRKVLVLPVRRHDSGAFLQSLPARATRILAEGHKTRNRGRGQGWPAPAARAAAQARHGHLQARTSLPGRLSVPQGLRREPRPTPGRPLFKLFRSSARQAASDRDWARPAEPRCRLRPSLSRDIFTV